MSKPTGIQVEVFLFFEGRCEEALEFYREAAGAEVLDLMRYRDAPETSPQEQKAPPDKVMYASFRLGDSTVMASDGTCQGPAEFRGFNLTLTVPDAEHAGRVFQALSEGGKVVMPLAPTFYSPCFGMLVDRFGVGWMVMAAPAA